MAPAAADRGLMKARHGGAGLGRLVSLGMPRRWAFYWVLIVAVAGVPAVSTGTGNLAIGVPHAWADTGCSVWDRLCRAQKDAGT